MLCDLHKALDHQSGVGVHLDGPWAVSPLSSACTSVPAQGPRYSAHITTAGGQGVPGGGKDRPFFFPSTCPWSWEDKLEKRLHRWNRSFLRGRVMCVKGELPKRIPMKSLVHKPYGLTMQFTTAGNEDLRCIFKWKLYFYKKVNSKSQWFVTIRLLFSMSTFVTEPKVYLSE